MSEIVIVTPETGELEKGSPAVLRFANDTQICNENSLGHAADLLRQVKTMRKTIADKFSEPVGAAWKAHKAMVKMRQDLDSRPRQAEHIIKQKIADYHTEQERVRQVEQDRLREIARKEAEDRQIAEAAQLEADGETEAADQVLEAPQMHIVAPTFPTTVPKTEGVSMRTTWKARIVNVEAIPRQYMIPNEKAIQSHARSMGAAALIPGVEFYTVTNVAAKAY